jgi:hypothetical protein
VRHGLYHGIFFVKPHGYLINKFGCMGCSIDNKINGGGMKLKTIKQFVLEARLIHGDLYSYLKSIYKGAQIHIIITCKEHGDFWQTPEMHLKGGKCNICTSTKHTNEEVDEFIIANNLNMKRLTDYSSLSENMDFICLICLYRWPTSFSNLKYSNCGHCIQCKINKNNKEVDDHFIENNMTIKRLSDCISKNTIIDWECVKCGHIFTKKAWDFLREDKSLLGCSKCNLLNNEKIDDFLKNNNIKIKRVGNYIDYKNKLDWQCLECDNIWPSFASNIKFGYGCPDCSRHKNEKSIKLFLKNNNIESETIKIKLPINIHKSIPDFYIPSMNLIIEYNGEQHYRPVSFGGKNKQETLDQFAYQQIRDQQMRDHCMENNINLLEIDGRTYKFSKLIDFLHDYFKIDKAA